jgi:hypothetical protein
MWHACERSEITAFLCESLRESDRLQRLGLEGNITLNALQIM